MKRTTSRLKSLAGVFAALAFCMLAHPASAFAQQETRYSVLMLGKPAGSQTSVVKPDGAREYAFEFSDRGRGPKLTTRIRLDAEAVPVSLETTGNDYLKAPVAETFSFENGVARWKNTAEAGERRLASKAFYNSMNGAPEEFALLAQALLKSPDKRMALLPEGKDERYRESEKALLRAVKMLYDAGVPLVAGTDATPGFSLHRELELYVEAGIPAREVLRIATLGAARVMKRDGQLGSIAPGKLADLILVEGDPTRRIADIRRVSLVVKDGNVYDPAALYKSIGVRQ
jgi:Amidohydrolase family